MMNNECQAGTKAATLMLHNFKRPASFFAMLLLCAVFVQAQQRDTIKVIMLACDTSNHYGLKKQDKVFIFGKDTISSSQYYDWVTDTSQSSYNNNTYWITGFKVMKYVPAGWYPGDIQHDSYWEFELYLDYKKSPINKNWIVWQSVSK